ncbi:MAG: phosphoribosyltransferase [Chloroflexota bacterium]|nr:MAG: phosphoribosyltransferase [Chloroflexota bacterium]
MRSYDYVHRKGVRELTWDDFAHMSAQLAEQLDGAGVEAIVGIARAGLFPATAVACNLRRELYPARITRRVNDEVVFDVPVWRVPVSSEVAGKVVAVIDEIADSGQTLALAAAEVRWQGASKVLTACLVRHSWADPVPDFSVLETDELIIFPWDSRIFVDGRWQPHPEIVAALEAQGKKNEKND